MTDSMIDAPVYVDIALAIILAVAAGTQYVWLAFHGHSIGRWLQAIGFTGLAMRILWTVAQGQDPHIAAISIAPLCMICIGATITAVHQMRSMLIDVRCLQNPLYPCFREDRLKKAAREHRAIP